ncbi:MAG: hypothetical protein L6R37_005675 [Teloschistes peruensis]|nr:MAG: hypothetical protein L6R37_005675 [Teloschistes peruensis]
MAYTLTMLSICNEPIPRATGYRKKGGSAVTRSDECRASILGANDDTSERPSNSFPQDPFSGLEETASLSVDTEALSRISTDRGQRISSTNVSLIRNPFADDESTKKETDSYVHAPPDYSPDEDKAWSSNPPHARICQTSKSVYKTHTTSPWIAGSSIDLQPAFFDACRDEDEALINLLLQKRMNLHTHAKGTNTHHSYTAIHTDKNPQPETPFLHHRSLETADEAWLTTPLCLAVLAGHLDLTHLLLKSSLINVNSCCPTTRMTVLHLAAITPSPSSAEILSLLRASGAVVDSQDAEGNTPLHGAVTVPTSSHDTTIPSPSRHAAMIVKTLLCTGARVDIPNRRGQYALTLVAQTLDLTVFRLVLAASAMRLSDRRIVRVEMYLRGRGKRCGGGGMRRRWGR